MVRHIDRWRGVISLICMQGTNTMRLLVELKDLFSLTGLRAVDQSIVQEVIIKTEIPKLWIKLNVR